MPFFFLQGMFNANYRTSNVILHGCAVPLNPDHTHFIFVDDGHRIRYEGVAEVRSKLEQKISQPKEGWYLLVIYLAFSPLNYIIEHSNIALWTI